MIKRSKIHLGKLMSQLLLIFFACIFLMPLLWQISSSLKLPEDVFKYPPEWIPDPVRWQNYPEAVKRMPFFTYLKNTIIVSVLPVFGQLLSCSLVAYSFTKIPWKGGKVLFPIVLATIMLPFQVTMIPVYGIWTKLNLVNTFWPLILPSLFGGASNIFLLRQFYKTIPDSYIDSARIDGAGEARILFQIMMPLSKPILTTIALFTFIGGWNDFQGPLLYLNDGDKFTLAIGLQVFLQEHNSEWELLMAASTLFMLPMIVIFFIGQKQFIKGIVMTGFK